MRLRQRLRPIGLGLAALCALAAPVQGQAPATPPPAVSPFHVDPLGYGLRPEPEPPRYVRPADATGVPWLQEVDWLDVGVDTRLRFEYRDNDYRRRVDDVDETLLLRTRIFVGVRQKLDPFRFVVEVQDSRRTSGPFPSDDRDVNVVEPIQAFAGLHFAGGAGQGRPISIKVGRQAFEYMDRRLIARNEWRNTTNTFDGLRAAIGGNGNAWQVDVVALKPVERRKNSVDRRQDGVWLTGAIGNWRRWSRVATLQPFYLRLTHDSTADGLHRDIHSVGLRSYAVVGSTGVDWDVTAVGQRGDDRGRRHRAAAVIAEAGYTVRRGWTPRVSANVGYVSGDRAPDDEGMQRFERLFGFARPFSASDYIQMENLKSGKLRVEFAPTKAVRVDAGASAYWLASATDRWNVAGLRDPSGSSGTSIGREVDLRVRFPVGARVAVNLGYARFWPGAFARSTSGRATPSQLPYVEVALNAFR